MNFENLQYGVHDAVANITLNRPDKLNSFNESLHQDLAEAVSQAAIDPQIRSVLLTANGRGFCAGQDLSDPMIYDDDDKIDLKRLLTQYYTPLIQKITGMDKPVICAVNGIAAGAGANLALSCDIVIAARSASFLQAFSKIGLVPDAGGTWMLPRLIGHARASAITLLGEKISAEQAEQWGMIWKVVEDHELQDTAKVIAANLANGPTVGLAHTKRLLQLSWQHTMHDQLALETDFQCAAGASEDFAEGVKAFNEKRSPIFSGR